MIIVKITFDNSMLETATVFLHASGHVTINDGGVTMQSTAEYLHRMQKDSDCVFKHIATLHDDGTFKIFYHPERGQVVKDLPAYDGYGIHALHGSLTNPEPPDDRGTTGCTVCDSAGDSWWEDPPMRRSWEESGIKPDPSKTNRGGEHATVEGEGIEYLTGFEASCLFEPDNVGIEQGNPSVTSCGDTDGLIHSIAASNGTAARYSPVFGRDIRIPGADWFSLTRGGTIRPLAMSAGTGTT
jgi:hypothetical protein